jgi:hypothetical protein
MNNNEILILDRKTWKFIAIIGWVALILCFLSLLVLVR